MFNCYIVNTFTEEVSSGNTAAVCILQHFLDTAVMQNIATENNVPETAFIVEKSKYHYEIRFFTPKKELEICGQATLAAAFVVDNFINRIYDKITFATEKSDIEIRKNSDRYELEFESMVCKKIEVTDEMIAIMGERPIEAYLSRDLVLIFENEQQIKSLKPDFEKLKKLPGFVCVASSKGEVSDIAVRTFCPKINVNEIEVCGSAHISLAPIWAEKLNKNEFFSKQYSKKGGTVYCQFKNEFTLISGSAVLYQKIVLKLRVIL